MGAKGAGTATATSSLTLTASMSPLAAAEYPGLEDPYAPATVGAVLGSVQALARVARAATAYGWPVVTLLDALGRTVRVPWPPEHWPASLPGERAAYDTWWAVSRTWPALTAARTEQDPSDRDIWNAVASRASLAEERDTDIKLRSVKLGSPLQWAATVPWEWFVAGGGGMVFVNSLAAWLNVPLQVRVQRDRLIAEQAVHRADAAEARVREEQAQIDLERLKGSTHRKWGYKTDELILEETPPEQAP